MFVHHVCHIPDLGVTVHLARDLGFGQLPEQELEREERPAVAADCSFPPCAGLPVPCRAPWITVLLSLHPINSTSGDSQCAIDVDGRALLVPRDL